MHLGLELLETVLKRLNLLLLSVVELIELNNHRLNLCFLGLIRNQGLCLLKCQNSLLNLWQIDRLQGLQISLRAALKLCKIALVYVFGKFKELLLYVLNSSVHFGKFCRDGS